MKIMKQQFYEMKGLLMLFILSVGFGFSACDINNNKDTGTMRVSMTDAPAHFEEVNIEVRQVLVAQNANEELEEGDGEDNWHAIMEDSLVVNLLDYQNGSTLPLGETELEAGQYNQVRLLLGNNNNVVIGGETIPLTTPSSQQSGFKLLVNATVEEGQVYDLVIDFDAHQSIKTTGNGKFILSPVLRSVNLEEQASISGTVLPVEAATNVYAITGEDTVSTQADENGEFMVVGLEEGTFDVWFEATSEAYADSTVEGIELEAREQFEFEETIQLEATNN